MVLECINCCNRFHTKHINGISRRKLFIKYFEGKVKNYLWNECCQYHFIDPGNFCDNIIVILIILILILILIIILFIIIIYRTK